MENFLENDSSHPVLYVTLFNMYGNQSSFFTFRLCQWGRIFEIDCYPRAMCCRGDIRWFRVSVSVSHLNLLNMIET